MIEIVFTLDYEIYGDGTGELKELVYDPAERLREIFSASSARFVVFVEAAEFDKIEACGADPSIRLVKRQIRELYEEGHDIGLHLHPQWSNARYERRRWVLDYSEYNLCALPRARIAEIVGRSLDYLRSVVGRTNFAPLSFRAGNWLFQPTEPAAGVLAENGIKLDSSVFKGGLLHNYDLDYRPALKNGYCWRFSSDVNTADPAGELLELPIYTELVPFWRMASSKRLGFSNGFRIAGRVTERRITRFQDFLRLRYPRKLDFCRMTFAEMTSTMDRLLQEDRRSPEVYKPIVAIGHTKDVIDTQTIEALLDFLGATGIRVVTFEAALARLHSENQGAMHAC